MKTEEKLDEFGRRVFASADLQAALAAVTEREAFTRAVIEAAAGFGLDLTAAEIDARMFENGREWNQRWMPN